MREKHCPKCGDAVQLVAPKISDSLWFCDNCGHVYPEFDEEEIKPEKSEPPPPYNVSASESVWDGEGP